MYTGTTIRGYLCPTCGGSGTKRIQQPTQRFVSGSVILTIEGGTIWTACECCTFVSQTIVYPAMPLGSPVAPPVRPLEPLPPFTPPLLPFEPEVIP